MTASSWSSQVSPCSKSRSVVEPMATVRLAADATVAVASRCEIGARARVAVDAALKLGARHAIAVDHDPQAVLATRDNAARNAVDERLVVQHSDAFSPQPADLVVANILANVLVGIVGSSLGFWLAGLLGFAAYGSLARGVVSVTGAVVLIWILKKLGIFK